MLPPPLMPQLEHKHETVMLVSVLAFYSNVPVSNTDEVYWFIL